MSLSWDMVVAHALSLENTGRSTHYGKPTVSANGRALIGPAREGGSFVLHIDIDTKQMLMETDPGTYWQTPHYAGWPALLVRYGSDDPERVLAMIERSHAWAMQRKPRRPRKTTQPPE